MNPIHLIPRLTMRLATLFVLLSTVCAVNAQQRQGGMHGGGGGKKEPLFKEVATNIKQWIESGYADEIESKLPKDISLTRYKTKMLQALSNYNIQFTDEKIYVNGSEKTCRSDMDDKDVIQIRCNNTQFGSDTLENINEIYKQVHHEFAVSACWKVESGWRCIEQNRNEESDYQISQHISKYLRRTEVKRLPVGQELVIVGTARSVDVVDCADYATVLTDQLINEFRSVFIPALKERLVEYLATKNIKITPDEIAANILFRSMHSFSLKASVKSIDPSVEVVSFKIPRYPQYIGKIMYETDSYGLYYYKPIKNIIWSNGKAMVSCSLAGYLDGLNSPDEDYLIYNANVDDNGKIYYQNPRPAPSEFMFTLPIDREALVRKAQAKVEFPIELQSVINPVPANFISDVRIIIKP